MEQDSSTKANKANENRSSGNVPVGPDGVGGNSPAASQPDGLEQLGAHGKGMPARCLRRGDEDVHGRAAHLHTHGTVMQIVEHTATSILGDVSTVTTGLFNTIGTVAGNAISSADGIFLRRRARLRNTYKLTWHNICARVVACAENCITQVSFLVANFRQCSRPLWQML